jgi:hypothetical protein
MWIAETCDEIAVRDVPEWKFWLEMGSLLRDVAAAMPAYNDHHSDRWQPMRPSRSIGRKKGPARTK